MGSHSLLRDLPNPGIKSRYPPLQAHSLTALAIRESPHHLTHYIFIFKDCFLSLLYGAAILLTQQCTPSAQEKKIEEIFY